MPLNKETKSKQIQGKTIIFCLYTFFKKRKFYYLSYDSQKLNMYIW